MRSYNGFHGAASKIERTNVDSTAKEFIPGLVDLDHFGVEVDQDNADAGQIALITAILTGLIKNFKLQFPNGPASTERSRASTRASSNYGEALPVVSAARAPFELPAVAVSRRVRTLSAARTASQSVRWCVMGIPMIVPFGIGKFPIHHFAKERKMKVDAIQVRWLAPRQRRRQKPSGAVPCPDTIGTRRLTRSVGISGRRYAIGKRFARPSRPSRAGREPRDRAGLRAARALTKASFV